MNAASQRQKDDDPKGGCFEGKAMVAVRTVSGYVRGGPKVDSTVASAKILRRGLSLAFFTRHFLLLHRAGLRYRSPMFTVPTLAFRAIPQ